MSFHRSLRDLNNRTSCIKKEGLVMALFVKKAPKNTFLGKSKAKKYLKTVNKDESPQIDLLSMYVNGELEIILQGHDFDLIEVFVDRLKNGTLDLQINLRFGNKNIGLDFFHDHYEYCYYLAGCTPDEVENSIIRHEYTAFDFNGLLKEIASRLH
jgi:hypothetical protein